MIAVTRALIVSLAVLATAHEAKADNQDLVNAARKQIGVTTIYDGSYRKLGYPGGDVPLERGVCTDVVVRTLRAARSMDLQRLVHEDMSEHPDAYSRARHGQAQPDANIDHRRVPARRPRAAGDHPGDRLSTRRPGGLEPGWQHPAHRHGQ
jgi:uncharacterized protein YijF (DUF1287 family)